eukprot:667518-Prorocentrum_minimum.AAC.1
MTSRVAPPIGEVKENGGSPKDAANSRPNSASLRLQPTYVYIIFCKGDDSQQVSYDSSLPAEGSCPVPGHYVLVTYSRRRRQARTRNIHER